MKKITKTVAKIAAISAAIYTALYAIALMRVMCATAEISGLNMMRRNNK